MKTLQTIFVILVLGVGQLTVSYAAEVKLAAGDVAAKDRFGRSVSISGDTAIVGAHQDDDAGTHSGAAHIFVRRRQAWARQAKLTASDAAANSEFGFSVAISGDIAIVGAHRDNAAGFRSGAAYIFVHSGTKWIEQAKLTAGDALNGEQFGSSVAISGDTAIIGAWGHDDVRDDSGAAYIFVHSRTKWIEQAKLTANDKAAFDEFGFSVAISGDIAIVGAYRDDDAGADSGAAYIFVRSRDTWAEQAKLTASDAAAGDEFGISVSISGDTAIVGAHQDDDAGADSGAAYIFVRSRDTWAEQAKLTASDAAAGDRFGNSVSISGNFAIVGAHQDDDVGNESGSAYSFLRSGSSWNERAKQTASDAAAGDQFGNSVSISGDYAIVGAYLKDEGQATAKGSAYIYHSIFNFGLPVELSLFTATTLGQVKRTALLQNFPNPFNPETWLPYKLAADAPVTIRIYDVQGQLVRQLDLGMQGVGSYISRENAAYWDGKNQPGHAVSSGLYFYTLTAGDFQATRRMVILK